jgi:hypothetical protein
VGGRGEPLSPPEPSLVTDAYGFRQWNGSSPSIFGWGHYPSILQRGVCILDHFN